MIHRYQETFVVVKLQLLKPFGLLTLSNISTYYSLHIICWISLLFNQNFTVSKFLQIMLHFNTYSSYSLYDSMIIYYLFNCMLVNLIL